MVMSRLSVNLTTLFLDRLQYQNQNCLLVTRQNANHSPGPGPGRLVRSSHQRNELSNSILSSFNRGDKRVWECIPIPNDLGERATLININVSNGDLICQRMMIPAAPNQGDKFICWLLALPFRSLYNNMSLLSLIHPCREGFPC